MDDSFELDEIEQKASEYAKLGVKFDNDENYEAAFIYYKEAIDLCMLAINLGSNLPLKTKIKEYLDRAELLKKTINDQKQKQLDSKPKNDEDGQTLKRAEFLINEALEEDENGNIEIAIDLYMEAIDLCIKLKNETKNDRIKQQLENLIQNALERAEKLKGIETPIKQQKSVNLELLPIINESLDKLSIDDKQPNQVLNESKFIVNEHKLIVVGEANYTKKELQVLKITSRINNREFVPFLSVDLKERFASSDRFTDKDGLLKLSEKQRRHFAKWCRLDDLVENPTIIKTIDCFSIKQTIVTDCSFIASLTVSAQYEKRFQKKLVTSLIYPQNKRGEPIYNPSSKYMIKLFINGVYRKVIIDDLLPADCYMGLLCSYSSNSNEYWISLLEKAYLKVMGGYDFPGSNSSIDLQALTGWIPDRIDLDDKSNEKGKSFDGAKTMKNLSDKFHSGHVLITVATGDLTDEQSERTGLVPSHAYALLNIRLVQGKVLMLLKNPWANKRWKGAFSECDQKNWTPELIKELKYDPQAAKAFDDGTFWIDLRSFSHFFKTIYLNWNPSLFKYTFCCHSYWGSDQGPKFDFYSYDNNPQYKLSVSQSNTAVWALLTRHITDKDDFANNKVYLAIVVFKGGEKIYVQKEPYIDGTRINSPHYLCKIPIQGDCKDYTLVISQYQKTQTIYYSLRIYSVVPFNLKEIIKNFNHKKEIKGEWNALNSGGCMMHQSSYSLNPVYRLEILCSNEHENDILIEIKAPKDISVGFDLYSIKLDNPNSENSFFKKSVDAFRYAVNVLEIKKIPKGEYNLIPCTYNPNIKSPYIIKVESTTNIQLQKIK